MKYKVTTSIKVLTTAIWTVLIFVRCSPEQGGEVVRQEQPAPASDFATNKYLDRLTKDNCTLIMVDFLTGFDPGLKTIERPLYMNNVTALAKIGNIFKLPTIILGDEGGFRGNFYPVLAQELPNATKIARHTPSAWQEPNFVNEVKKIGRNKLIMGGISIDNCTLHLALDALAAGYEVYVVVDASGTDEKLVEQAAMLRLTQAGAVMTSWVSLASELLVDWENPEGPAVGKIYQDYSAWGGEKK